MYYISDITSINLLKGLKIKHTKLYFQNLIMRAGLNYTKLDNDKFQQRLSWMVFFFFFFFSSSDLNI